MDIEQYIKMSLAEDIGDGDHTSLATIPLETLGYAELKVKQNGILAGIEVAKKVFKIYDSALSFEQYLNDGDAIIPGDIAFKVNGSARSILTAERLVLNIMQRMSGIATHTAKLKQLIQPYKAQLLDTRKTTPLNRTLEKEAVKIGGGLNHRFGLFDMILIKDNHIDFCGGVVQALRNTKDYLAKTGKNLEIEVEVRSLEELRNAMSEGGFRRVLIDNFTPELMKEAVTIVDGKFETEASGGINENTINSYAATGVDYISVGALTHHIQSLDLSLKAVFI
jgi:nicotinate-nucleotide pyrophosphorylase (carboxylating)